MNYEKTDLTRNKIYRRWIHKPLNLNCPLGKLKSNRNLKDIGPEIAAFYLDGIKILRADNFETAPYLLAHITREIDGGLRDILSSDEDKAKIQKQLTKEILAKIGDYNTLKEYRGHIASILAALRIDDVDVLSKS